MGNWAIGGFWIFDFRFWICDWRLVICDLIFCLSLVTRHWSLVTAFSIPHLIPVRKLTNFFSMCYKLMV